MVPHYSGTTLDAQKRYAEGVRDILERYFAGKEQEPQNLIVQAGAYATKACEYPLRSCRYSVIAHLRWSTLNLEASQTNVALSTPCTMLSRNCVKYHRIQQITTAHVIPLINTVSLSNFLQPSSPRSPGSRSEHPLKLSLST